MEELAPLGPPPAKRQRTGGRYRSKRCQNNITKVVVPEFEPRKHPDRAHETRTVSLYTNSTRLLWLHLDDIPWFIAYLKDEADIKQNGIPESDDVAVDDTQSGNQDGAVPHGFKVDYDFKRHCWKAFAHSKDAQHALNLCGISEVHAKNLNDRRWNEVQGLYPDYETTPFIDATGEQKHHAARLWLCSRLRGAMPVAQV